MTYKKQKNGKWRTRVYLGTQNGKRVYRSVTADTKAECQHLANIIKFEGIKSADRRTIGDVVDKYIASIEHVASPCTIRGYRGIRKNYFKDLMLLKVDDVDSHVMQNAINDECQRITYYGKEISPKSVANAYGLISTSLKKVCGKTFDVRLPQEETKIKEFPMPKEIMQAVKGTDVELPCLLAMWLSLSLSEIRGLDCSSVRDGVLHVEQVRVESEYGEVLKKTGKVDTRIRNHVLPDYLMQLINNTETYINYRQTGENQPLIPMTRNVIYKHWKKIAVAHGWEMSFHDLRAVSASIMLLLGIPDKYAMQRGGWRSDYIYKRVYQQTFDSERQAVDKRINDYLEQYL